MAAIKLELPATEEQIRSLRIGDEVRLYGTVVTARDVAHKFMVEEKPEFLKPLLKGTVIYHCGPIVKKVGDEWTIVAAGPTTSSREEPYQAEVIETYGVAGVIGKAGMGEKTSAGLKKSGAVYFHAVGGAGALLARCVKKVKDVLKLEEFGSPEAFWVMEVEDFPTIVTMDSHGDSLHRKVLEDSEAKLKQLL
ncbi:MAG: fumarate hydratase C-terminal domain-containing protein [Deltaproteobacteria bacterium]|nr:fumarate hydratase C-terminal domain-containing protein [Deltaproteobacteria bacterium]